MATGDDDDDNNNNNESMMMATACRAMAEQWVTTTMTMMTMKTMVKDMFKIK